MRIGVTYSTRYRYAEPARGIVQMLRLTPAPHDGQQVLRWRVEPSADGTLREGHDAFGNIVHAFYCDGPIEELNLQVDGLVATEDRSGVINGAPEPLPPALFLRETPLTRASGPLGGFARDTVAGADGAVAALHALNLGVHRAIAFDAEATQVGTDAAAAFALGRGVCQDLAHIFIAAARLLGHPARYVSGHLMRSDGARPAAHAWGEAHVPGLGWVGFDPVNAKCPGEEHVRVAVALDYLGAAPVRGARAGGGTETLSVEVSAWATQSQSQSQTVSQQSQSQSQSVVPDKRA